MTGQSSATAITGIEPYTTEIRAGGGAGWSHQILADEPVELGGRDRGPGPFELLCASLSACKTITCRMYADRKGWKVDRLAATVRYEVREIEGEPRGVLVTEMQFVGDLDGEQLERLFEISDRCPVNRLLKRGPVLESSLILD
ncbi:MAG: OsmC family protein [Planctomycetota bacterium]